MIVVHERRGQLCNRLFLSSYAQALGEATGQTVADLCLNEYAHYFPVARPFFRSPRRNLRKHGLSVIKRLKHFRWGRTCIVQLGTDKCSLFDPNYIATVRSRRLTVCEGWFAPGTWKLPDSDTIRERFKPEEAILRQAHGQAQRMRPEGGVLIGLHIRRGDYATWVDGRYFYPLEFWPRVMQAMVDFFPRQKVTFIVCSNESLDPALFSGFSFAFGPGTTIGDLYTLAECDYILGPLSTFSQWAAFYGRKPLYLLRTQEPPSSLDQFQLPYGIKKVENQVPK